jgi:Zn-dependent protease with chaperone function
MIFSVTAAVVAGGSAIVGAGIVSAIHHARLTSRKRYSQAQYEQLTLKAPKAQVAASLPAPKLVLPERKEKYAPMFAPAGIDYEVFGEFCGVDLIRVTMPGLFIGYYPMYDCIVVTAESEKHFTGMELKALLTHEIGHKVHCHTVAGYLSMEEGIAMELAADAYAIKEGMGKDLYAALVKLFEVSPRGADYEPRMLQLQSHLKEVK